MAKIFIEETTLTAIGDAIREKEGSSALVPVNDMASRISAIQGGSDPIIEALEITSNGTYTAKDCDGYSPITVNVPQDGGPTAEELVITGNCQYRFAYNGWNWFIEKYGNAITTANITGVSQMFAESTNLDHIPFEINCSPSINASTYRMFYSCYALKELPKIINIKVIDRDWMFYNCRNLCIIPDDFTDTWDWSAITSATSSWNVISNNMFMNCYSLRSFPRSLISYQNAFLGSGNNYFYNGFLSCYALDELVDLPIPYNTAWTSNAFYSTFTNCSRLKRITFETNADGTPLEKSWKSQTIDLSSYTGWLPYACSFYVTNYNSGITADKKVTTAEVYQTLKNDPDWFTESEYLSRYNHDSAVETINTLPDTSAYLAANGGTNTIKFKGIAGTSTDGGAINTLTEEEIAVATAKGWTVTFA